MTKIKVDVAVPRLPYGLQAGRDSIEGVIHALEREGMMGKTHTRESSFANKQRNFLVEDFLKTDADYMLNLDSDHRHHSMLGVHLVERAEAEDLPIVSGLYFTRAKRCKPLFLKSVGNRENKYGKQVPHFAPMFDVVWHFLNTYFYLFNSDTKCYRISDLPWDHAGLKIDGAGAGALLIRRDVLEAMQGPWFHYYHGCSRDLAFFLDAKAAGFQAWGDMSVCSGHYQNFVVGPHTFMNAYRDSMEFKAREMWEVMIQVVEEYTGKTQEEISELCDRARFLLADEWAEQKPETGAEVRDFHRSDLYMYDIMYWNCTAMFQRLLKGLTRIGPPAHALSFGGGIGNEAICLARHRWEVDYIDLPGPTYDFAQHWANVQGAEDKIRWLIELEDKEDKQYQLIVAIDIFEHLPDLEAVFGELMARLIPGGLLYFHNTFDKMGTVYPQHIEQQALWDELVERYELEEVNSCTLKKP